MLVLGRRKGEKLVFPDVGVEVVLLRARSGHARLGVVGPPHVRVVRGELLGDRPKRSPRQ